MSQDPKIIKIRWCRQCGDKLPNLRGPCSKDSKREPHVVEVFELPPILETAKCGCCIRIACQLDVDLRPSTCKGSMWRPISIAKMRSKQYCSRGVGSCQAIGQAMAKKKAVIVECGNETCEWGPNKTRKKFERHLYRIKNFKRSFCCPSCQFIQIRREQKRLKLAKKEVENGLGAQLLSCRGHRGDVTEHALISKNRYRCIEKISGKECGATREGGINITEVLADRVKFNRQAVTAQ